MLNCNLNMLVLFLLVTDSTTKHKSWAKDNEAYSAVFEPGSIQFGFTDEEMGFTDQTNIGGANIQFDQGQDSGGQGYCYGEQMTNDFGDKPAQQSKLQASLKQYERRNKKKRPPNYYQQEKVVPEYGYQELNVMHQNYTVPPPGHPAQYRAVPAQKVSMDPNIVYHNMPMEALNLNNAQVIANSGYSNPNVIIQGTANSSDNGMLQQHVGYPPQGAPTTNAGDDLTEVVVHSLHCATEQLVHIPSRTETNLNQDHERTSKPSVSVGQYASDNERDTAISQISVQQDTQSQHVSIVSQADLSSAQGAKSNHVDISVKDTSITDTSSHKPLTENIGSISNVNSGDTGQQTAQVNNSNTGSDIDNTSSNTNVANVNNTENDVSVNNKESSGIQATEAPKPKPTSWAGLFKSASTAVTVPPQTYEPPVMVVNANKMEEVGDSEKPELPLMPVPAADDSVAKELGGKKLYLLLCVYGYIQTSIVALLITNVYPKYCVSIS